MPRVLIIDDEKQIRHVLRVVLQEQGFETAEATTGEAGLALYDQHGADAVLLDLNLPGMDGLAVLAALRQKTAPPACVLMTAFGSIRTAVEAIRKGAYDFVTKPFDNDDLVITLRRALEFERLRSEVRELRRELRARYGLERMVGPGRAMHAVFDAIDRIARVDETVLITGESGTGKELAARAIHEAGARAAGPFITVNCGAIPATLFESELFGHERGAFTDAREARVGRFEQASGGVLFLDEVGELPLESQVKLLRVLEDRLVMRLGAPHAVKVDVRVIAATNRPLEQAVKSGTLRQDLFYRLGVLTLELPPLRERREDIPALVAFLVEKINARLKLRLEGAGEAALGALERYDWPGNVRELENVLCQAMIFSDGRRIELRDLPARLRPAGEPQPPRSGTLAEAVDAVVAQVEREMILARLAQLKGSRTAAAQSLGISRKTLFNKMRQHGLTAPGDDSDDGF